MPWTASLKSTTPAVVNATNPALIDVTLFAVHTDTRTTSKVVSSDKWTVAKIESYAQDWCAQLTLADTQKANSLALLPGINSYIGTNPILASG